MFRTTEQYVKSGLERSDRLKNIRLLERGIITLDSFQERLRNPKIHDLDISVFSEFVHIEERHRELALKHLRELPDFQNSIRGSQGRTSGKLPGTLGEIILEEFIRSQGIRIEDNRLTKDPYEYDYLVEGKVRIEVKTKARTFNSSPPSRYDCSVAEYVHDKQVPDGYYFVSLVQNKELGYYEDDPRAYTKGYILGGISRSKFDRKSVLLKKGDIDPSNGYKVRESCFNVKIADLSSNLEMLKIFKNAIHST